jgi:hypothetical protein
MELQWLQGVKEMRNGSQVQQHVEKSQWPMHIGGL